MPDLGILRAARSGAGAAGAAGAPQRRAVPPGRMHMRGAAAWPLRRPRPPPSPPRHRLRPKRARKANKDVLVSALLEAQEGGNQCLVNGKRENRSGKTVYFQAREGCVNSTGHCGGSTAGHKTPPSAQAEECWLSAPRASSAGAALTASAEAGSSPRLRVGRGRGGVF